MKTARILTIMSLAALVALALVVNPAAAADDAAAAAADQDADDVDGLSNLDDDAEGDDSDVSGDSEQDVFRSYDDRLLGQADLGIMEAQGLIPRNHKTSPTLHNAFECTNECIDKYLNAEDTSQIHTCTRLCLMASVGYWTEETIQFIKSR